MNFGWLPEIATFKTATFTIEPLSKDRGFIRNILSSPRVNDDWFYPPLEPEWLSANEIGNKYLGHAEWFALPATHALTFKSPTTEEPEIGKSLVAVLGLLKGLQLVPEGWGHFYRTPLKPGRHVDFHVKASAVERILDFAFVFWSQNSLLRKSLFGALNWHLFGLSYEHPFERFAAAYSVLDTCWHIHTKRHRIKGGVSHAGRVEILCRDYDLDLPPWAQLTAGSSRLSMLRNEYFHESLWGSEPIGLGHPVDVPGIHLELFWFNTRLLLAVIGERSNYTRSPIRDQRQLIE